MATMDRYTRSDVLRIAGVSPQQLSYWERLELILPYAPRKSGRAISPGPSEGVPQAERLYTFADLIGLRTIKQLTEGGVPASRLRDAVEALRRQLAKVEVPLAELRILSNGRNIAVEYQGRTLEPLSGQLLFNFDAAELADKVTAMPERTPEEWFALALDCEGCSELHQQAIEAYHHVIQESPGWVEPHLNLGILLYEQGDLERAAERFRRAVALAPDSPLAHFNLGCVLDELKQFEAARQHLREAVRLKLDYADAHYNLARVCDQLGACAEARTHWRLYLELDPDSRWAEYARQRLEVLAQTVPGFYPPRYT
jgi:tetratricopeptide (TPR) repeat protein